MTIDIASTFIRLDDGGGAELIKVTPSFWRGGAAAQRYDRLIGAFDFRSAEDLHPAMQEMHPEIDEVLVIVSGAVDVVLEEAGAERTLSLESGRAAIVPRGVWHRLVMRRAGRLLFINNRKAIQSRPLRSDPGGLKCNPI